MFLTLLVVSEDPKSPTSWRLERGLVYKGQKHFFLVPEGFVTDFASTPRAIWWLIPPYGRYTRAAVLHDWFYRGGDRDKVKSRSEADGIFRKAMKESGVGWRRWAMWAAVRLFGWRFWRKDAQT